MHSVRSLKCIHKAYRAGGLCAQGCHLSTQAFLASLTGLLAAHPLAQAIFDVPVKMVPCSVTMREQASKTCPIGLTGSVHQQPNCSPSGCMRIAQPAGLWSSSGYSLAGPRSLISYFVSVSAMYTHITFISMDRCCSCHAPRTMLHGLEPCKPL